MAYAFGNFLKFFIWCICAANLQGSCDGIHIAKNFDSSMNQNIMNNKTEAESRTKGISEVLSTIENLENEIAVLSRGSFEEKELKNKIIRYDSKFNGNLFGANVNDYIHHNYDFDINRSEMEGNSNKSVKFGMEASAINFRENSTGDDNPNSVIQNTDTFIGPAKNFRKLTYKSYKSIGKPKPLEHSEEIHSRSLVEQKTLKRRGKMHSSNSISARKKSRKNAGVFESIRVAGSGVDDLAGGSSRKIRSAPSGALSDSPLTERWAVIGGKVLLPCDVTPHPVGDAPLLMLISRGETPIYSVDARKGGRLDSSIHWSSPNHLATRARFLMVGGGALEIDPVHSDDQSDYHCRVEFRDSPTRNSRVRLQIVVVPQMPQITDEAGRKLTGMIGPYDLGETITLACHVRGGYPNPRVTWWHERFLLDDLSEVTEGVTTVNRITLPNLSRQHLDRKLTCQADNSNLTKSLQASVTLNMSFPPASVDIVGFEGPLSEGRRYSFSCQVTGSRPPATLLWYEDGIEINQTKALEVHSEGETQSTLVVNPTRADNGKTISCRGTNPLIPDQSKEDVRLLTVHYPPAMSVKLGANLDARSIKERDDVYFECIIDSNPPVSSLRWFLNGEEVKHNTDEGIILSNRSLVLQRISRRMSGDYTCAAANSQGEEQSQPLHLEVQFTPVCAPNQQWVYGGGRREPVNLTCLVESSPIPHAFRWSLNTSASDIVDVPRSRAYNKGLMSVLAYTPHTPLDYGALLCWAENSVGLQQRACVYQVVPAAVPEQVHNCSAWHNSSASGQVVLRCWPGWDGGLQQTFSLEVLDVEKDETVASLENQRSPRFTVTGLKPGLEYLLRVTAKNSQGSADAVTMTHLTPIDIAEKRLSKSPSNVGGVGVPTALGVMGGVASVLLLCCLMMVMLLKVRNSGAGRAMQQKAKLDMDAQDVQDHCKLKPDREPDVILISADGREQTDDMNLLQREDSAGSADSAYSGRRNLTNKNNVAPSVGPNIDYRDEFRVDTVVPEALYMHHDRLQFRNSTSEVMSQFSGLHDGEYHNSSPLQYSLERRLDADQAPMVMMKEEMHQNSLPYQSITGSRHTAEAICSLTSPEGTLETRKGPPKVSFKPSKETSLNEPETSKSLSSKEESLLRVQSLKGKLSGKSTPGRVLSASIHSPQRESIV
ncbi:nephrin [Hyalella azteca]|uniref:Nephrin n=2 Tax=Hyalella azteca TaxID=294128 RepID=A0A8B7NC99_HYAAZ|nr:nephrin [Hyalella azteca]